MGGITSGMESDEGRLGKVVAEQGWWSVGGMGKNFATWGTPREKPCMCFLPVYMCIVLKRAVLKNSHSETCFKLALCKLCPFEGS